MRARQVPWVLGLVGLMVALSPVGRAEQPEPERIRLACEPGHVVLGTVGSVEVRVELAPDATGLELFASLGTVGEPTTVSPGVFRSTYVPLRQNRPREVILSARARTPRGEVSGWTLLPLWGQGEVELRTRPETPVSVQVGARSFGPVLSDARGVARVPVAVPPGMDMAFSGARRISLGLPPWPAVHAIAHRQEVRADLEEHVDVRVYLSRIEGTPPRLPRAFALSVSRGTVSEPVEEEPGVFLVRWRVPPGPSGPLTLSGSVAGAARWSLEVQVEARPGPARAFEMRVDREELVASEDARVRVEVSVRDAVGNPTRAGLRLESELSGASALVEQRTGEYATWLKFPAHFAGQETSRVRLLAEGQAAPVETRELTLRAGSPSRVHLAPLRPVLVADGVSEAVWRIAVEDRFGNPVARPLPEALLAGGGPSTLLERAPGRYELRYVPPESRVDRPSEVELRVGPLRERGALSLLRRSVLSLAPRVGLMTNLVDVRALSARLRLEVWPLRAWPWVGVWLDAGYLRFSRSGGTAVPGFFGENEIVDTSLALGLRTPREYAIQAWASAGVGVARVRSRTTWDDGTGGGVIRLDQGTFVPGLQATLGVGWRAGPGRPFIELQALRFNDPALPVLRGALQGLGLSLGYRLELF